MENEPQFRPPRRFRPKVPTSQRKRIERACTRCRTRKRKCRFAQSEICLNCQRDGHSCVLEPVSTNETGENSSCSQLDPALQDIEYQFRLLHPECQLKSDHWNTLSRLFSCRSFDRRSPGQESDRVAQNNAEVSYGTGKLESVERSTSSHRGQSEFLGFGNFLTSASGTLSQSQCLNLTDERIGYGFPLDYTVLYNTTKEEFLQEILAELPTQAEANFIISTFFLYASPNWYSLDEVWCRHQVSNLYERGLDVSCAECDFLYLVLMVFALGSQFVELRQVLAHSRGQPGVQYLRSAVRLLPLVLSVPSLETCQGLFLTGLYLLPMSQSNVSYTYIALALRVAVGLDLHQNNIAPSLSARRPECGRRIFWTLYCIERRLGIALGYPENIQQRDIKCPLPRFQEGLDGDNPLQIRRLQAFVNLTLILSKLMRPRKDSWPAYLHEAQTGLQSWWRNLPTELRSLESVRLRANAHLHINYHQAWIHAGRESLICLVRERLRNKTADAGSDPNSSAVQELSGHCVESANEMINLLNLLRTHRQLSHFSFTDFHSCVLATIIILLGSILNPCAAASHQVQAAMDTLRFMAEGNENAKGGVHLVESFLDIVNSSLSSLCERLDERLDDGFGARDVQQQPPQSQTVNASVRNNPPATGAVPGQTGDAYPGQGQSLGRVEIPGYDDIWAVLNECSVDELRFLGINGLFDGN